MNVWHSRLGHASCDKLAHIDFLKNVNIDFLKNVIFNNLCDSCSRAKHTKHPFQNCIIKIGHCFELLHCDVWGRYHLISLSGATYFLTIVDDYSRSV